MTTGTWIILGILLGLALNSMGLFVAFCFLGLLLGENGRSL